MRVIVEILSNGPSVATYRPQVAGGQRAENFPPFYFFYFFFIFFIFYLFFFFFPFPGFSPPNLDPM